MRVGRALIAREPLCVCAEGSGGCAGIKAWASQPALMNGHTGVRFCAANLASCEGVFPVRLVLLCASC